MGRNANGNISPRQRSPKIMTEEQYLAKFGVSAPMSDFMVDKIKYGAKSAKAKKAFEQEAEKAAKEYSNKRQEKKAEYEALVKEGKIVKPTSLQKWIDVASGHPDNAAVQAARRILKKKWNITWSNRLKKYSTSKT